MTRGVCGICGPGEGARHTAREKMFGLGDEFGYFECGRCGALQLVDVPADLGRYYPAGRYYSLQATGAPRAGTWLRRWVAKKRDEAQALGRGGVFGRLARRHSNPVMAAAAALLEACPVRSRRAKILDIGCGSGVLLRGLAGAGFTRLYGADPFAPEEPGEGSEGVTLYRCEASEVPEGDFDLILLTHSLEHIGDQMGTLRAVARLLGERGVCRIETPIADSEAWRRYGVDWVELDAPRHLFVHTRRSMVLGAEKAGLDLFRSENAGRLLEVWGSEWYRRGGTLFDAERQCYREPEDVFGAEEIAGWRRQLEETLARQMGGVGRFYLRRGGAGQGGKAG